MSFSRICDCCQKKWQVPVGANLVVGGAVVCVASRWQAMPALGYPAPEN